MPSSPARRGALRSVELHILLSVVDRARHGYAILQEAGDRTQGHPGFEIPTLYRALRRLRDEGLIEAVPAPEDSDEERRDYWAATDLGRAALRADLSRMETAVAVGRARLGEAGAGDAK